jgi:hypothetical protein
MASIGDVTRPAFAYDEATDTWVPVGIGPHSHTASGVGAVATSSFAAKGDLVAGTGAGTLSNLTVGANNTILTADSSTATGLKWAAPAGGGVNFTLLGTASLTGSSVTISGISGQNTLHFLINDATVSSSSMDLFVRINGDTGANYYVNALTQTYNSTYSATNFTNTSGFNSNLEIGNNGSSASSNMRGAIMLYGCNTTNKKHFIMNGGASGAGGFNSFKQRFGQGYYNSSSTISSITIQPFSGTFTAGTIELYGSTV